MTDAIHPRNAAPTISTAISTAMNWMQFADRAGRTVAGVTWQPKVRIALLALAMFAALC